MNKFNIILIIFILVSCEARLSGGKIIGKWYEPPTSRTHMKYNPAIKVITPITIYDDEDYVIIVRGFNGKDTVTQRFEISRVDYYQFQIGDYYRNNSKH